MRVEKVALHELDEFIKSDRYKQFKIKPITPMRAASYLRNPHARAGDNVLYMLLDHSKLIAFRTLFADKLTGEDEPFAWLSGNWVDPEYRRHGYSEKLLEEVFSDWKGRLMFTNYAPASLELYLKTGKFYPIYSEKGTRFYLFAKPSKLLKERMPNWTFILSFFDFIILIFASLRTAFYREKPITEFDAKIIAQPDAECYKSIKKVLNKSLFDRGKKSFQWIFSNPWVSTVDKRFSENYPFSSFSKTFRYETLKLYGSNKFKGFILYSVRDKHLKVLYNSLSKKSQEAAVRHLSNLAAKEKIEMMTVLDPELAQIAQKQKNPFIKHKTVEYRIYSSFKPEKSNKRVQAGDGDVIFS